MSIFESSPSDERGTLSSKGFRTYRPIVGGDSLFRFRDGMGSLADAIVDDIATLVKLVKLVKLSPLILQNPVNPEIKEQHPFV